MSIPFTEKYRPRTLEDICLPQYILDIFAGGVKTNMLFFGAAGTGKTSAAKILATAGGTPFMYLNASSENSVETVRNKISSFCSSSSLFGGTGENKKVVILDEFDFFTPNAFAALRANIEKYACNTCFIATCNYIERIPGPIRSRFKEIDFDFTGSEETKESFRKRIRTIVTEESYDITDKAIDLLLKKFYPDMRKIVSELQTLTMACATTGHIDERSIYKTERDAEWLFKAVLNKGTSHKEIFETVFGEYVNSVQEALDILGRPLIKHVLEEHPELHNAIPDLTVLAAKYQFQYAQSYDKAVCLLACISEMRKAVAEAAKKTK